MASFEIETAILKSNLTVAGRFLSPKSDRRDSTKCIKFIAGLDDEGDFLELKATNLDVEFTRKIRTSVVIHAYGEFIVRGTTIIDYVKAIEDESIIMTVNSEGALVICEENASLEVATGENDDFPEFANVQVRNSINIDASMLYDSLQQAFFATAGQGHGRLGALDAVCLDFNDRTVDISGTDTQRASLVRLEIDNNETIQYLVSSKSCEFLKNLMEGEVEICLSDRAMVIRNLHSTILMKRINGDYPDIASLMPSSGYSQVLFINTKTLLNALSKVKLAVSTQAPILISISDGLVVLRGCDSSSSKKVEAKLPIEYRGDTTEFSVNCDHIISLLKVLDPDSDVELNFEYDGNKLLFKQGRLTHLLRRMEV